MENEFFIEEEKKANVYPWYFSIIWLIANIFIGSLLSIIFFYIGRLKYRQNKPTKTFIILGFVFMAIAWIANIYFFYNFNNYTI